MFGGLKIKLMLMLAIILSVIGKLAHMRFVIRQQVKTEIALKDTKKALAVKKNAAKAKKGFADDIGKMDRDTANARIDELRRAHKSD